MIHQIFIQQLRFADCVDCIIFFTTVNPESQLIHLYNQNQSNARISFFQNIDKIKCAQYFIP